MTSGKPGVQQIILLANKDLIHLMIKFELCYELRSIKEKSFAANILSTFTGKMIRKVYLAPQLLSIKKPEYVFPKLGLLHIRYIYEIMPKGIMARLIVRLHNYIKEDCVWKEGVVINRNESEAEITEDRFKREINIYSCGSEREGLLYLIRENIEEIHYSFDNLIFEEMMACVCSECVGTNDKEYYRLNDLKRAKEKGRKTIECRRSFESVLIANVMGGVYQLIEPGRVKEKNKIFLLHSQADESYKRKLQIALSPLTRQGFIEVQDLNKILAGGIWEESVKEMVEDANVILLLISSDFIASKFYDTRIMDLIWKKHSSSSARVIPIIIRPCNWELLPIKNLNVLPKNKIPLSKFENIDEGLTELVDEINEVIIFNG